MNYSFKMGVLSILALFTLNSCGELYNFTNRCTSSHVNPDWDALERNLSSAEALWKSKKPISDYRYIYSSTTFGGPRNVSLQVSADIVTARDSMDKILAAEQAKYYGPVENLFSSLRSSITNRDSACRTISVTYNSSLGYPETFFVADEKEGLQDAFGGFAISEFSVSPLIPPPSNL